MLGLISSTLTYELSHSYILLIDNRKELIIFPCYATPHFAATVTAFFCPLTYAG